MKPITLTFPFGAGDAMKDQYISPDQEGVFARVLNVTIPNFSGTLTGTITIYDELGNTVYTKAALAKNITTYDSEVIIPISAGIKVTMLLSVIAGSVGNVVVTLFTV